MARGRWYILWSRGSVYIDGRRAPGADLPCEPACAAHIARRRADPLGIRRKRRSGIAGALSANPPLSSTRTTIFCGACVAIREAGVAEVEAIAVFAAADAGEGKFRIFEKCLRCGCFLGGIERGRFLRLVMGDAAIGLKSAPGLSGTSISSMVLSVATTPRQSSGFTEDGKAPAASGSRP